MTALLFLIACTSSTESDSSPKEDTGPSWVAVGEGLDSALLSIWGSAWNDVWVVGADPGTGGVLLHFDGTAWEKLDVLGDGDAWWIEGTDSRLWISGANGRLFHYDRATGTLSSDVVDSSVVLYGIWAAADNDAWAVGGTPGVTEIGAVMYHYDGSAWTKVELPPEAAALANLFKVSGKAANDVWVVGESGMALHYDGSTWSVVPTGITPSLFGIRGRYAVGGNFTGALLAWTGSSFIEETPAYSYQLSSVADDGVHPPTAVGYQGQVYLRGEQGWNLDPAESATLQDLHSVWIDPDGGVWSVGGHLASEPLIHGVLVYKGEHDIAPLEF